MTWRDIDSSSRRALVFTPMETRREVIVDAAIQAEALGYEAVIVPEGWGLDASIVLAEIAMRTERIKLVAGILSIWNRTPATIAMTAATLDDLSDGRFVLGLGASTAALTEGLHDVASTASGAKLRATITEVRALLRGERASTSLAARGLRLGQAPRPDLPIWVAGLGPRSVVSAAQLGDGWLPAMLPRSAFDRTRQAASEAATDHCEIITCVMAGVDHGGTTGQTRAEQLVGWYLTGMGPFYGDVAAANGFEAAVDAVRAANPRPKPGSIVWPRTADELLDQLAVFGDPDAVRSGFGAWDELTDVVAVGVGPGGDAGAISALIEAAAPVQPPSTATATSANTCTDRGPVACPPSLRSYIEAVEAEGRRFAQAAETSDLDVVIPACPDWVMRDLVRHLGEIHLWAAANIVEPKPHWLHVGQLADLHRYWPNLAAEWPSDAELISWYRATLANLIHVLEDAPLDVEAFTFLPAPSPLMMWARRQASEIAIHRFDAESAQGVVSHFDPFFAADMLDELITGFAPHYKSDAFTDDRVLQVVAADVDELWWVTMGPAGVTTSRTGDTADLTITGTAAELYLLLWNRMSDSTVRLDGDARLMESWRSACRVEWSGA